MFFLMILFKLWIINIDAQVYNIQTDTNKICSNYFYINSK